MSHTCVIAEIGSTHDGEWTKVADLAQQARDAGASAVKLQYWSNPIRLAERRHAIAYEGIYRKYQIPVEWLEKLAKLAQGDVMCTVYLPEDIAVVAPYVARFKVASFEASDTNFILDHLEYNKDVIISTGMMNTRETWRLLGLRDLIPELKLLHCVSAYPAPLGSINLAVIRELGLDGFSDHSGESTMGMAATLAGAKIIEVHVRHWNTDPANPDFGHSLTPGDLKVYVEGVRYAEKILGNGEKVCQEAEREMAKYRVV